MLFGNDDFEDDASEGFDDEDVWEVNEEWLMAPVTPPPMLAVPPPSVYEVGGPSTTTAEGPSFPLPAPGLPIPPSVIEDLSTCLGTGDSVPDGSCCRQMGAGLTGSGAAERQTYPAATDYSFLDGQPGDHTDVVYFRIG
ncbi:hypothetical protein Tco_1205548 [Tanacetum coccineum]